MHETELKKGLSKCFPFSVGFTAVSSAKMTRMCPCSAVECSADKTKKEISTSLNENATTKSTMRAFPTSSAVTMTEETKDSTTTEQVTPLGTSAQETLKTSTRNVLKTSPTPQGITTQSVPSAA